MFAWIKRKEKARYWQQVALSVYQMGKSKPKSWDCDQRVPYMVGKMKERDLVCNKDFAIQRGWMRNSKGLLAKHIRLTIYGHTLDPSTQNRDLDFKAGFNMVKWSWGKYRKQCT